MKKLMALVFMVVLLASVAAAAEIRLNKPTISSLMFRDYFTGAETAYAEENALTAFVTVENEGCGVFKDLKMTILVYDLDFKRTYGSFDLCNEGDRERFRIPIMLPANTPPGVYPVRITISDDDTVVRVRHRWIILQ